MQRFQQILQRAITEQATSVTLSANSSPVGALPQGDMDWVDFGNVEAHYIENLFKTLFPSGVQDKPERGQIDVPNFGKLLTIAVPGPIPRLLVFMPAGHAKFQPTWDEIINAINADPLETVMPDNPFEATMTQAAMQAQQAPNPMNPQAGMTPPPPPPPSAPGSGVPKNYPAPPPGSAPDMSAPPTDATGSSPHTSAPAMMTPPPPAPSSATSPGGMASSLAPGMTTSPMDISAPPPEMTNHPLDVSAPPQGNPEPPADVSAPPQTMETSASASSMPDEMTAAPPDIGAPPPDITSQVPDIHAPLQDWTASPQQADAHPSQVAESPAHSTPQPPKQDFASAQSPVSEDSTPPMDLFADMPDFSSEPEPAHDPAVEAFQPDLTGMPGDMNFAEQSQTAPPTSAPAPAQAVGQAPSTPAPAPAPAPTSAPAPDPAPAAPPPPPAPVAGRKLGTTIEPGVKEIDEILRFMLKQGASDLHVTAGQPIALRIDGEVARFTKWTIDEAMFFRLFNPITSEHNQHEFYEINDTDFAYEIPGEARFRVNLFRDRLGPCAVLRQIPSKILTFEDLKLPEQLRKLCYLNKGLVVVTGPTGSGKSTTLAALVDHMNDVRKDHILTLEDPIEFVHPQKNCLIRQREIHKHTTSFARALRAALREDPDIILVGELRDLETTALAIEIAETGHLVMATLHTTTAVSTIDRIIDQFSADQQEQIRTMLSESLKGVVAQTLMRKIGGGRCAAQEILMVDSAVSALIREGKTHMIPNQMQSGKAAGNILLNDALNRCVLQGLVEPKEAWMKSVQKTELLNRFRSSGVDMRWYDKFNEENKDQKAS